MKHFEQILTTLNLSSSDTREDTLKSIIKTTLYDFSADCTLETLKNNIITTYGFEPYKQELDTVLEQLDDSGDIRKTNNSITLTDETKTFLKRNEQISKDKENKRCANFISFIKEKYNEEISPDDYSPIWKCFLQYLYQCFFHYGEKATNFISPKNAIEESQKLNNTDILYSVLSEINRPDLTNVLKFSIDNFSDFATQEDIDFIDSLGQKTLSFSSLGLNPEIIEDGFDKELIDWILFLDTNYLFSILNLHVNVEDDACNELLKLLANNPTYIKVKLYYSDLTLKELKHKKIDFRFIEESLTKPAIKALLRSDHLDVFSRRYYSELLNNPSNTLHPSKVVDVADTSLKGKQIDIFNTGPQRKILGEEYLNKMIVEYQRFINNLNDYRNEFYQKKTQKKLVREVYRSEGQKEHDITLREIILLQRNSIKRKTGFKTLNQIKYFGITLDELLIRFDNHEIRKKGTDDYPTFFRPSFLLNKLIKILPVKTDNYKKAFIKAVSARGFYKEPKRANDAIKIVNYLKNQGIDNEEILLNTITEKVFLDKYREESTHGDFNEKEFIENQINKVFNSKMADFEQTKKTLHDIEQAKVVDEKEIKRLSTIKEQKEEQVNLYFEVIKKLQTRVSTLEGRIEKNISLTPNIDFEGEATKQKALKLENELKIEKSRRLKIENEIRTDKQNSYIKKKIRKWRTVALISLVISLIPIIVYIFILYSNHQGSDTNFLQSVKQSSRLKTILSGIVVIINVFTGKLVYDRFFNESIIKAFKERIDIPKDMKEAKSVEEFN